MANWDHLSNIGTHPDLPSGRVRQGTMDSLIGGRPPKLSKPEDTHVPVGNLVTVTIGRNIGSEPMGDAHWLQFRNDVTNALREYADVMFGPFEGVGEWEGVPETSAIFTAIVARPFKPGHLDQSLACLAESYVQDAIAWSYGAARLARP